VVEPTSSENASLFKPNFSALDHSTIATRQDELTQCNQSAHAGVVVGCKTLVPNFLKSLEVQKLKSTYNEEIFSCTCLKMLSLEVQIVPSGVGSSCFFSQFHVQENRFYFLRFPGELTAHSLSIEVLSFLGKKIGL